MKTITIQRLKVITPANLNYLTILNQQEASFPIVLKLLFFMLMVLSSCVEICNSISWSNRQLEVVTSDRVLRGHTSKGCVKLARSIKERLWLVYEPLNQAISTDFSYLRLVAFRRQSLPLFLLKNEQEVFLDGKLSSKLYTIYRVSQHRKWPQTLEPHCRLILEVFSLCWPSFSQNLQTRATIFPNQSQKCLSFYFSFRLFNGFYCNFQTFFSYYYLIQSFFSSDSPQD